MDKLGYAIGATASWLLVIGLIIGMFVMFPTLALWIVGFVLAAGFVAGLVGGD